MDQAKFDTWWRNLSAAHRGQLRGLAPGDALSPAVVPSLVRYRGSVVPRTWWDDRGTAHDRFPLPEDVHVLIHAREAAPRPS